MTKRKGDTIKHMELWILCSYCHLGSGLFPQVEAVILRIMWLEPVGFWVPYKTLSGIHFYFKGKLKDKKAYYIPGLQEGYDFNSTPQRMQTNL